MSRKEELNGKLEMLDVAMRLAKLCRDANIDFVIAIDAEKIYDQVSVKDSSKLYPLAEILADIRSVE